MTVDPIIVDSYPGDLKGHPNHAALIKAGYPFIGHIMKAMQGVKYAYTDWFVLNYAKASEVAGDRLGVDFFLGSYQYLVVAQDGRAQAEAYLKVLERVQGLKAHDFHPMIDIERSGNPSTSKQQVEDVVSAAAETLKDCLGRPVILYGGSYLRDLKITSHMGCDRLFIAAYSARLDRKLYQTMGWDRPVLWQYQGTGSNNIGRIPGYPVSILDFAGPAMVDLSVYIGENNPTVADVRRDLTMITV